MVEHIEITDQDTFNQTISGGVTLVDFYTEWCGSCRLFATVIDEVAEIYEGKLKVVKLDIDKVEEVAREYNVMSVPAVIIFKDGQMMEKNIGLTDTDDLSELVEKVL